ncbi:hypothetical protein OP10G_1072 [Fimbriimonas ginsengisoli Gsoil 348]|uniref:Uncharacterized protein n=1 Tax=Fimbriimonas ginsengisoli Gsoil 348 TaxID=661478 RepID=A0A068NNV6_FIMGI|nr:hypothetical protein OP10G_1072 [Fimbriimonas ginsengisoli Gsoil 348]
MLGLVQVVCALSMMFLSDIPVSRRKTIAKILGGSVAVIAFSCLYLADVVKHR